MNNSLVNFTLLPVILAAYATACFMETCKKTIRVRLYPNKRQAQLIDMYFGASRFVYNRCLSLKINRWQNFKESVGRAELSKMVTFWKKTDELSWMRTPPRSVFEWAIVDLERAYKNFFCKRGSYPKFKSRGGKQSFVVSEKSQIVEDKYIRLPKIGLVRIRGLREFLGEIKNVTVKMNRSGQVHATFCVDHIKSPAKTAGPRTTIGIDVNIENFCTDSDSRRVENPRFKKERIEKIKHYQRSLAKCKPGSRKHKSLKTKIAREFQGISNRKRDFTHKLSFYYVQEYDLIKIEALNIVNMVKNKRLSEAIYSVSWGEFFRQLQYKANFYGKELVKVNPAYTSKTCSCCKEINQDLRLHHREWTCVNCSTVHCRDVNSAINIKNKKGKGLVLKTGGVIDVSRACEASSQPERDISGCQVELQ